MKKRLAILFISLLIFSNLSIAVNAQSNLNFVDPRFDNSLGDPSLRLGFDLTGERVVLGFGEERNIGEDIIVNVDQYEPRTIRSSLIEQNDILVRALLIGTPSNPSITIPRIRGISSPRLVNV